MGVRLRVGGEGYFLEGNAAAGVAHSLESLHGSEGGIALPYHGFGDIQSEALPCGADVRADVEAVGAALQYPAVAVPGRAGIIVGSQGLHRDIYRQPLALAGLYRPGLVESAEDSRRLTQSALGSLAVYLHHLAAGDAAGVGHGDVGGNGILPGGELRSHAESGVGKPESEWEAHLVPGKGFKVAVADVDILAVAVLLAAAEVLIGGAGEHHCRAGAADHSALPYIHHGGNVVSVHESHVDKSGGVQQHDGILECGADALQHILLQVGEQECALFQLVVHLLAGGPADDDDGGAAALRRGIHDIVRQRHFLLGPRLAAPALAVIERVLAVPRGVGIQEFPVNAVSCTDKSVGDTDDLGHVHHSAAAGAALVVVQLYPAEYRRGAALLQRKRAVVLQQHDALRNRSGGGFKVLFPVESSFHVYAPYILQEALSAEHGQRRQICYLFPPKSPPRPPSLSFSPSTLTLGNTAQLLSCDCAADFLSDCTN